MENNTHYLMLLNDWQKNDLPWRMQRIGYCLTNLVSQEYDHATVIFRKLGNHPNQDIHIHCNQITNNSFSTVINDFENWVKI